MKLVDFQIKAIADLMDAMSSDKRDIVLKSCTGSGKTIILTHFMDEYCKSFSNTVFVWLTPGKGQLEEQSKEKMDLYIHGSSTKLLADVMTGGFEENDCCFINWEKLTKKGNNALKDSERTNFLEHIEKAQDNGLNFIIIVDESHQNNTIKADDIIKFFKPEKIIRCSATPTAVENAINIEIPEEEVIAAGLIKKLLVINENFSQDISVDDQISYLLDKALSKQQELFSAFASQNTNVNPLIIVQIPNKNDILLDSVERWFESKGITYENHQLAVWLSDKKENLEEIEKPDAEPVAVIIKQAVATGWDCPRAQILVKLRDNMDEKFEIQTIGRIRRMPEAKHYENDLLDSCYLYTLDEKFTESAKTHLGKGALNAVKLFLKEEHRQFTITTEFKTNVAMSRDPVAALKAIYTHYQNVYKTDTRTTDNKIRLEAAGYTFSNDIVNTTKSGQIITLEQSVKDLNDIRIREKLNTHKHGQQYHHVVGEIGLRIGIEYSRINTIIRRLFFKDVKYSNKILSLDTPSAYAFVINNAEQLRHDIRNATSDINAQTILKSSAITEKQIKLPLECLFTYDAKAKKQAVMTKNVYDGYLSSAEVRSAPEKAFEKYCESCKSVDWWYKNGDKGEEYLAIVYTDNFGKQKSFYPDYILSVNGETWIIETKGGFDRYGNSKDIDKFSPLKFPVLKTYLDKHGLKGGFVREDEQSQELCICMNDYNDDIHSDSWELLSNIIL